MHGRTLRGLLVSPVAALVLFLASAGSAQTSAAWAELDDAALLQRVDRLLHATQPTGPQPVKCLFPYLAELEKRGLEIQSLERAAPTAEFEYLTPEGHFRVQYDLTGTDAVDPTDADQSGVPDYVEWVAEAMEESWSAEVETTGFPPIDLGPGERYRVQLKFYTNFYGLTNYANVTDPGGSNIAINSNFTAFYQNFPSLTNDDPDGLVRGAIRVTCAHEFKHALQVAGGWNVSESPLWVEVDATSMEEVVYDGVNDYYNYVRNSGSPFTSPQISLVSASYEDVTWQLYLFERYGAPFLTAFDAYRSDPATRYDAAKRITYGQYAYQETARALGHDWQDLWREYALWNFLTSTRATSQRGFDEAAFYPLAPSTTMVSVPFTQPTVGLATMANRFYVFDNSQRTAEGGVRLSFTGQAVSGQDGWGVSVVLQRPGLTAIAPLVTTTTGPDTLETQTVDVADFDLVAVVVGNGNVEQFSTVQRSYSFTLEFDPALVSTARPTFGSIKGAYRNQDQR